MTDIQKILQSFIDTAEKYCPLKDMIYIKAFPNTYKSSYMYNSVTAFSVYSTDAEPEGLGENVYSGQLKISAAVYVPFSKNQSSSGAAAVLCESLCSRLNIRGIKLLCAEPDDDTECIVSRVIFTIDNEIFEGGA